VDNTVFLVGGDAALQENETDEARKINAHKKEKNDMFRLNQNRYGMLQEEEPNPARNAKNLGIISFYEHSKEKGIWCTHSFFVPNPVIFRTNGKAAQELVLYKGSTGDIFFFNQKEVVTFSGSKAEIMLDL